MLDSCSLIRVLPSDLKILCRIAARSAGETRLHTLLRPLTQAVGHISLASCDFVSFCVCVHALQGPCYGHSKEGSGRVKKMIRGKSLLSQLKNNTQRNAAHRCAGTMEHPLRPLQPPHLLDASCEQHTHTLTLRQAWNACTGHPSIRFSGEWEWRYGAHIGLQ